MSLKSEIYHGTFESIEHSGILDGMSSKKKDKSYSIQRGIEILKSYDAIEENPYPTGSCGHLYFGTHIPLNYEDKDELFQLGWYESISKWPPESKSVEQYGFNTVKVRLDE